MTDDEVRLKALVDAMRNLGDPLSGTSLYQQAATVIESLSRDLAAAKNRIAWLEVALAEYMLAAYRADAHDPQT